MTAELCRECGTEASASGPEGHCANCLLLLGLGSAAEPAPADRLESSDLTHILAKPHGSLGVKFHRLADYELIEEIARGGMGVVFRARHVRLSRTVALKFVLGGRLASPALVKRFQVEAEAAASLQHPHIVSIFEIGEHDGHHFYSMELVEGASLDQSLAQYQPVPAPTPKTAQALGQNQRHPAQLISRIARAVDYAHQRGVLHRDLKPSNILIDRSGEPHLTDFGLAKLLHSDRTQVTVGDAILGTPNYMAPEVASGRSQHATTAADIYSLGAILYELLTGVPPFQAPTAVEIWRRAVEEEPKNPTAMNRAVDLDLATICLHCLEKDPARRYASAQALADDLDHWLAGEPITARPVAYGERLWRWCWRKPALAGLTLVTILTGLAGVIGISVQARRAQLAVRNTRLHLYAADVGLAQQSLREGNFGRARQLLDAYVPGPGEEDLRGFEWRLFRQAAQGDYAARLLVHTSAVRMVAFSPDHRWLVTGAAEPAVKIWNFRQRHVEKTLSGHTGAVTCVAFSPDSHLLATGAQDGWLKLWDTTTWQVITQLACRPFAAGFAPHEPWLVYSEGGSINLATGRVRVWNYQTGQRLATWTNVGNRFALTPDGRSILIGGEFLGLWDMPQPGRPVGSARWRFSEPFSTLSIDVSPDGMKFAACSFQGGVRVFNLEQPEESVALRGYSGRPRWVAFSPNGAQLALAGGDQSLRIWNVSSWKRMQTTSRALRGHGVGVRCVAFSPDGETLASGDRDGAILLWDLTKHVLAFSVTNAFVSYTNMPPVFSRDSKWMAAPSAPGECGLWDLTTRERCHTFPGALIPLGLSEDHQTFTALGTDYSAQFWDVSSGKLRESARFVKAEPAVTATLSPDGHVLAVGYLDGFFALWDMASQRELWRHHGHRSYVRECAFSGDGRWLATASDDGTAKLWDLQAHRELVTLLGHSEMVWAVAISSDQTMLATSGSDHSARLWSAPSGQLLAILTGHKEGVFRVAFSPDNKTLATASDDDSVRLWHLATRREVGRLDHGRNVSSVRFSPDGELLVSGAQRNEIHFYPAQSFRALEDEDRRRIVRE